MSQFSYNGYSQHHFFVLWDQLGVIASSERFQDLVSHPGLFRKVDCDGQVFFLRLPSVRLRLMGAGLPGRCHGNALLLCLLLVFLYFLSRFSHSEIKAVRQIQNLSYAKWNGGMLKLHFVKWWTYYFAQLKPQT